MTTAIILLHLIACIALILIVLLQTGKGASLGAAFGGATQTVFGATGSAGFFGKLTTGVAIVFMLTSLSLSYLSIKQGGTSVMKSSRPVQAQKATPAAPPSAPSPGTAQKASPPTAPAQTPSPTGGGGSK